MSAEPHLEPAAALSWDPDNGFRLDLSAANDVVSIAMAGVAVPADGTIELRAGAIELFNLDILFKAQVDLDGGAPGQLQSASVRLVDHAEGTRLELQATVEDADTGEVTKVTLEMPIEVPGDAPARGGPRPVAPDEDDLDWEDEDTLEQLFTDPTPVSAVEDDADDGDDEPPGGFEALLKAIVSMTPDGTDTDTDTRPADPSEPVNDPGDARGLLAFLVERDLLAIEDGHTLDELVSGAAPIVAGRMDPDAKAARLSGWLLRQEAVEELYIDDDGLAGLLDQW